MGYNQNPPFYSSPAGGRPIGAVVEAMDRVAGRIGITLDWVFDPGAPEAGLREGRYDIYPMSVINESRRNEFHLTPAWLVTEVWLIWRDDSSAKLPMLQGQLLGVPEPRFFQDVARKSFATSQFRIDPSRRDLLASVCTGGIAAMIVESRSLTSLLLDRPNACDAIPLRTESVVGTFQGLSIMSTRRHAAAADAMRSGLSESSRDGSLAEINRRWRTGFAPEVKLSEELNASHQREERFLLLSFVSYALVLLSFVLMWRLRAARRVAESASETKSRFLANMSHELRTPVSGIIGLTEMLHETSLDGGQREMLATIQVSGRGLLHLLNDILDISKLEAGRLQVECIPFALARPVKTVAAALAQAARERNVRLSLDLMDLDGVYVQGDPTRLMQVLLNLTNNAIKFSPGGEVTIRVKLGTTGFRFEVADTGIGIDPSVLPQLFRPFTQADTSTARKFGGTGLGLSIARALSELMGGTLNAESRVGKGSVFWLELPLPVCAAPELAAAPIEPVLRSLRVLVVDDIALNRRVATSLTMSLGHNVEAADSGETALRLWRAQPFDVILLDCQMPEVDGYEVARCIRAEEKNGRHVWIVALTANAFEEDKRRSLSAGMDDHLSKPYTKDDLRAALEKAVVPYSSLDNQG